jgi:poly(A) polymerase
VGWDKRQANGEQSFAALQDAVDDAFNARIGDVSGRGKLGTDMREIWTMQPRFDRRTGSSVFSLVEQPRFRAGFDFLRLRAQTGEVDEELAHWWETFSTASDAVRRDMVDAVRVEQQKQKGGAKPTRVRRLPAASAPQAEQDPRFRDADDGGSGGGGEDEPTDIPEAAGDGAPARKRRRRRRKPGGGGGEGAGAPAPQGNGD